GEPASRRRRRTLSRRRTPPGARGPPCRRCRAHCTTCSCLSQRAPRSPDRTWWLSRGAGRWAPPWRRWACGSAAPEGGASVPSGRTPTPSGRHRPAAWRCPGTPASGPPARTAGRPEIVSRGDARWSGPTGRYRRRSSCPYLPGHGLAAASSVDPAPDDRREEAGPPTGMDEPQPVRAELRDGGLLQTLGQALVTPAGAADELGSRERQ